MRAAPPARLRRPPRRTDTHPLEPWSWITALIGLAIVIVTAHDHLKTVLTVSGGGPVTGRVNAQVWNLAVRAAHRHDGAPPGWLANLGPALAILTLVVWMIGLWAGWTLIFAGSADAILATPSKTPASLIERAYYAGYTLTTLGPGDYTPGTPGWQIVTVLAAVNGLFLFTMAITYIVPIITATAQQRQLATLVSALGDDPADLVVRSWHRDSFSALEQHLVSLTPTIASVRQNHLAYPILHFFHSTGPDAALPVQIAVLDDALALLAHGVQPHARPAPPLLEPLRAQLRGFLGSLASAKIDVQGPVPPAPDLQRCAEAGIPVVRTEAFLAAVANEAERRTALRSLVRSDGWQWRQVSGGSGEPNREE